jgi:hypothetical protein
MQSNSQGTTQVSPRVASIKKVKAKGKGEQPIDSISTKTVPNHSSMNWLSQRANKAPNNTEGHKAKNARKTQAISGSLVNGRSSNISTKVETHTACRALAQTLEAEVAAAAMTLNGTNLKREFNHEMRTILTN